MRLQTKILAAFIPAALAAGGATAWMTSRAVERALLKSGAELAQREAAELGGDVLLALHSRSETRMLAVLQELRLRSGASQAAFLSRSGEVLAHTSVDRKGRTVADGLDTDALSWRTAASDGGRVLEVSIPLMEEDESLLMSSGSGAPPRSASLRLALPLQSVLAVQGDIRRSVLLVTVLASGAVILLALWWVPAVLRPVRRLASAIRRVADGDYSVRVPEGLDELGRLAQDFNHMAEVLSSTTVSKRYLDSVLEGMSEGLIVVRPDGTMRSLNAAALRMLGRPEERVLGREAAAFFEEGAAVLEDALQEGAAGRSVRDRDARLLRDQGEPLQVVFSCAPFQGPDGAMEGLILVLSDVAERRRTEEALRLSEESLRQAQKMEAVGRLAGGVAHDFNNLLTAITGYAELLRNGLPEDSQFRSDAEEIQKAGMRAAGLTRQLLAFSRKQVLQPKILDLNAVAQEMHKMLARLIGEHIELQEDLEPGLARVQADPGQIQQVLLNLAVNARDAMPQGGVMRISTRNVVLDLDTAKRLGVDSGAYVRLEVSDEGVGMDLQTQAHVFEPFFTTKEDGKGTGLGLSTVYGIVRQSGGGIDFTSVPGKGTEFRIYLPGVARGAETPEPEPQARSGGTETVLLAEDESIVRALAARLLRQAGYTVLEAENGRRAIELARTHKGQVDLLLTDVVMPGLPGPSVAGTLRREQPGLRVLFMSGYTDNPLVLKEAADAASFLQKPFSVEALKAKVREALDARV